MRFILCEDVGLPSGSCTTWDDGADCPNRANHTPMPAGYGSWHHRAEELARAHDQHQCPGCGTWAIWVPKQRPVDVPRPHTCPSCRCAPQVTP